MPVGLDKPENPQDTEVKGIEGRYPERKDCYQVQNRYERETVFQTGLGRRKAWIKERRDPEPEEILHREYNQSECLKIINGFLQLVRYIESLYEDCDNSDDD